MASSQVVVARGSAAFRRTGSVLIALFGLLSVTSAFAHTGHSVAGGLQDGFLHPFTGVDHLLAMLAVGLWASQLGKPANWLLPVVFPLAMALGAALGFAGIGLPAVESGITVSVLILGLAVCVRLRLPMVAAAPLVGVFALFHGYAHGAEIPATASATGYVAGFLIATGLLHLAGLGLGFAGEQTRRPGIVRILGGLVAVGGAGILMS
jgi:urease accessory protein